ncbi:10681_t:CDS:1 [Acaulospora morrowiae]|uniref:10681_t:CDS:1 n=1 Tax=Acaulospora morrowiae TaxID=94023 RepID=A0A9N9AL20_9GLOM|nr:10681_t:CDS:1 [Acaulospora morrowiae]
MTEALSDHKTITIIYQFSDSQIIKHQMRFNESSTFEVIRQTIAASFNLTDFVLYENEVIIPHTYDAFLHGKTYEIRCPGHETRGQEGDYSNLKSSRRKACDLCVKSRKRCERDSMNDDCQRCIKLNTDCATTF